jgi:hypothetical protein
MGTAKVKSPTACDDLKLRLVYVADVLHTATGAAPPLSAQLVYRDQYFLTQAALALDVQPNCVVQSVLPTCGWWTLHAHLPETSATKAVHQQLKAFIVGTPSHAFVEAVDAFVVLHGAGGDSSLC